MEQYSRPVPRCNLHGMCLAGVVLLAAVTGACDKSGPSGPSALTAPTNPRPPAFAAPSGPTGSYTLTLTASPSCAIVTDTVTAQGLPFPESVRVRRYEAEFADGVAMLTALDGTGNHVHIGGTDYYIYYGMPLMTVTGTELTIIVPGNVAGPTCAGGDYWWEPADNGVFELCGTWRGSMADPTRIEGTISGAFAYHGAGLFCTASDHRFTLTKR